MNKITKEIREAIFTVNKQLKIQVVIDNLKLSHYMQTTEGKKLNKMGKILLQQLNNGIYNLDKLKEFLNYAKKLQSFEDDESKVPPILDAEENAKEENQKLATDDINNKEDQNEN